MGSNVDIRLVILGLDGAGKTTILYKLKVNKYSRVSKCYISLNKIYILLSSFSVIVVYFEAFIIPN